MVKRKRFTFEKINKLNCFVLEGLLISSVCEQEIEVMEIALGSVFPILLSSGKFVFR